MSPGKTQAAKEAEGPSCCNYCKSLLTLIIEYLCFCVVCSGSNSGPSEYGCVFSVVYSSCGTCALFVTINYVDRPNAVVPKPFPGGCVSRLIQVCNTSIRVEICCSNNCNEVGGLRPSPARIAGEWSLRSTEL